MFICFSSTYSTQESALIAAALVTDAAKGLLDTVFPTPLNDKDKQKIINYIITNIIYVATNIEKGDTNSQEQINQLKNSSRFTQDLYQDLSQVIKNEKAKIIFKQSWEKIFGQITPKRTMITPKKIETEQTVPTTTAMRVQRVSQPSITIPEKIISYSPVQQPAVQRPSTVQRQHRTSQISTEYISPLQQQSQPSPIISAITSAWNTIYYGIKALIHKLFGNG